MVDYDAKSLPSVVAFDLLEYSLQVEGGGSSKQNNILQLTEYLNASCG